MIGYSSGASQRSGHAPQRARKISRASSDSASAAGAIEFGSTGRASETSSILMTGLQLSDPFGASSESAFSVSTNPTRCDRLSKIPDPLPDGGGAANACAVEDRAGTAAAAASIAEKSNANAITTPTGGDGNVRFSARQPLGRFNRSWRACSVAMATARFRLSASLSNTSRRLASSADRSRLLAKTSTGQPIRSMNSINAAWRIPSRKNKVSGSSVDMGRPYRTRPARDHGAKVAEWGGCTLPTVSANPIRPVLGLGRVAGRVVLPTREPDAVERLPEHHRRAKEVCGHGAAHGHGGNLPRPSVAVAPNNKTKFGGSEK